MCLMQEHSAAERVLYARVAWSRSDSSSFTASALNIIHLKGSYRRLQKCKIGPIHMPQKWRGESCTRSRHTLDSGSDP